MSVFHSAATTIHQHEAVSKEDERHLPILSGQRQIGGGLKQEEWIRAVVRGADERSQRWKHLMALGGLLIGFEARAEESLSKSMRMTLEGALLQAANLALVEAREGDELGAHCVALVLNHSFGLLRDTERARLDYNVSSIRHPTVVRVLICVQRLLPVLVGTAFFSSEGFQSGYFLGAVDLDTVTSPGKKLNWPASPLDVQHLHVC